MFSYTKLVIFPISIVKILIIKINIFGRLYIKFDNGHRWIIFYGTFKRLRTFEESNCFSIPNVI